jgi:phage-related protein
MRDTMLGTSSTSCSAACSPDDFKPMPTIGKGVEEIRVWDESGTFRVIYTARLKETVIVLHAFQKKTQATSRRDVELARRRWAQLDKEQ